MRNRKIPFREGMNSLPNKIPDTARKGIVDKLILIGQVPGNGSYHSFFQRVYPRAAEIRRNGTSLLDEIARHCDSFPGDWGDDAGMFDVVDIFNWTDSEFLHFCTEYVNPVFNRFVWDDTQEERISLQSNCVEAINLYLSDCGYELRPSNKIGDKIEYELSELTGVKGKINNIVFAATMKPDILLTDVLNHTVQIPVDEGKYLLYDKEVTIGGLSWKGLHEWYDESHWLTEISLEEKLYNAVKNCGSPIEEQFFNCYLAAVKEFGDGIPALLPQVYLYYDSKVQKERTIKIFDHQCMDFLMLFSGSQRVVIELDGVQHYSDGEIQKPGDRYPHPIASTEKYASMVSAHREMTLAGYEVYRFGGSEFQYQDAAQMIRQFFIDLFAKHGIAV